MKSWCEYTNRTFPMRQMCSSWRKWSFGMRSAWSDFTRVSGNVSHSKLFTENQWLQFTFSYGLLLFTQPGQVKLPLSTQILSRKRASWKLKQRPGFKHNSTRRNSTWAARLKIAVVCKAPHWTFYSWMGMERENSRCLQQLTVCWHKCET